MPKKRSVNAETQSSAADDGETETILNTEPKPSLNAWKHGAYSNLGLLPGENRKEYMRFVDELFAEWAPRGPLETDTVVSLAKCMWRKSRLVIYAKAAQARRLYYLHFEGRESLLWTLEDATKAAVGRFAMVHYFHRAGQREMEKEALPYVVEMMKYGRGKDDKNSEEKSAEKSEAKSKGNSEEKSDEKTDVRKSEEESKEKSNEKGKEKSEEKKEQLHGELLEMAKLGDQMRPETLLEEIALAERLDARIDKLVKRLLHLKAAKQMI
jgi:hypothetical protein